MLEYDKDDKGGGAMIPSLSTSRAGTELSRLYTFTQKTSDSPVG